MARQKEFRVLLAADGSAQASAAIATTVVFPWPADTRVRSVTSRQTRAEYRQSILLAALDRGAEQAAAAARRALSRRWPDAESVIADKAPVPGVLGEADRFGADVIVVGWRGHGPVRRLLMGSISRGIVRQAECAVLVVRRRTHEVRRIVIGIDGSASARNAVTFVGRLAPPPGARVTLVTAVEQMAVPRQALATAAVRAAVAREVRRTNAARAAAARKALEHAETELERRGWKTRSVLSNGAPLRELLGTVSSAHAQLLVVGARGTSGVRHLLLGSVADGVLNRCPVPVLVVR